MTSIWINVDGERPSVLPVFCSPRCWVLLDWRPRAAGDNVSSQEARGCCQGNELHGVMKRIIYSRMVGVFGAGRRAHTLDNNLLSASVPPVWLWEGLSLSKKRHIARTEYSFQCTCSRTPVSCISMPVTYRPTKYSEIPSPMPQ